MITKKEIKQFKAQYPDVIVLARIGDFFQAFDEDAGILADVCDLLVHTVPTRSGQRAAIAGFLYRHKDEYVSQLIQAGYKVAVLEPTEEQEEKTQTGGS